MNDAINGGIDEDFLSKNLLNGNLDLTGVISEDCLKFFKWLLVNNDTCLELEDDYGLRLSGRSSIIEINTELWNDFTLEFIEKQLKKDCVRTPAPREMVTDEGTIRKAKRLLQILTKLTKSITREEAWSRM